MTAAPYSVILKDGLPELERELLRRYCHELHGSNGATLLHFLCTSLDLDDPVYLAMDVVLPRRQGQRRLRIPHALVFLIEGDGHGEAAPPLAGSPALPTA